jgi:hypothetical protein
VRHRRIDPLGGDLHAAMAQLIKADYGELIWRDRSRFEPIVSVASPITGRSHLFDAVAGQKLSAAKWLVRLGGRVREPADGVPSLPCPWSAALAASDPAPMLRVLLTSESLTPDELAQCADDLLILQSRALTRHAATALYEAYCDACRRIGRPPAPAPRETLHRAFQPPQQV